MTPISVRLARARDAEALAALAALDPAAPLEGEALVAVAGEVPVAAMAMRDGRAIADPFRPTADLVALLGARREQLRRARTFSRCGSPVRGVARMGRRVALSAV